MLPQELFHPKSVAVVGVSRGREKVGYSLFANLVTGGFPGAIYGVNPAGGELLGRPLFPSVEAIPGPVDLGVLAVPPTAVVEALPLLARKGLRAAIVISAGFSEVGGEGLRLTEALREAAARIPVRFLGPNCLGLIDTRARLNASFAAGMPAPGDIAFFSQSGALCTAVLDWALGEGIGFSTFISLGNKADVTEADVMERLAGDPGTRVIMGYVESIDDGVRFLRVARETTIRKPVVLLKAGATTAGARAASSHTGSLAGSDKAYTAAFRQGGILRAGTVEELLDVAIGFAMQPVPERDRLLVLTNAGGPGILAADVAERFGIPLAEVSPALRERFVACLPPTASLGNPVDMIGDARADRYGFALDALRDDPGTDIVLVLLTPQAMTQPDETAEAVVRNLSGSGKTAAASFMGDVSVRTARRILSAGGIPQYPVPERAVRALGAMIRYRRARRPAAEREEEIRGIRKEAAAEAIRAAQAAGRRALGETESRGILAAYGFVFPEQFPARTTPEAVQAFERIGGPVAIKIASPDILHKTDVGGVRLGLASAEDVARAFAEITTGVRRRVPGAWIAGVTVQKMVSGGQELILGMSRDPQFGPLLMYGFGGIYVEVLGDVSFRLAAFFSRADASEMVREIRSYPLLAGYRGAEPADEEAVVDGLLRIARLSLDFPEIQELDVNPAIVLSRGEGIQAIDCRMTIGVPERPDALSREDGSRGEGKRNALPHPERFRRRAGKAGRRP
jgi:acetate---CoA ligase (ADP-forming)